MKPFEITPQFISRTLVETFLYGFNYAPEKSYDLIQYLKNKLPKKTANYDKVLIQFLFKYLGPYDIFTESYYIDIFCHVYPNNTTSANIDLILETIEELNYTAQ